MTPNEPDSSALPKLVNVVFNRPLTQAFTYRVPAGLTVDVGYRVRAPFGRRSVVGHVVGTTDHTDLAPGKIREIESAVVNEPLFAEETLRLAQWVASTYFCSLGEALAAMIPGGRSGREAEPAGIEDEAAFEQPHEPSDEQREAIDRIVSEREGFIYLYGITGSGKTEVYLRAVEEVLSTGRDAIILVPEIALTGQVRELLQRRFGTTVAALHSRLTTKKRLTEWLRVLRGDARVVVGARSAVFAPVKNLGLIVVDEEHEGSYKSGSTPRYHARQVAMQRVRLEQARLVMGSATPSVESWQMMEQKRLPRLNLTRRLAGGSLPKIERVALSTAKGNTLTPRLVEAMRETLDGGRQVVLFLNRRGFSYFFHCRACGFEMTCPRCSVSLTYHRENEMMVCHYCGYRTRPVTQCPQCKSLDVGYSGFGTEQVEEEVLRRFPDFPAARLDTDAARKVGRLEGILESFHAGTIRILLGTQMVAKGLNFPQVRLVGIVAADMGLHIPDFRAAERTFSLITQVAGRAGRFTNDGLVILQATHPEQRMITLAAAGDIESFYREEIEMRRQTRFPPFARLIRLLYRGEHYDRVLEAAREGASLLRRAPDKLGEVLGPADAPLARINRNHRVQVLASASSTRPLRSAMAAYLSERTEIAGVYLEIDVDPVAML